MVNDAHSTDSNRDAPGSSPLAAFVAAGSEFPTADAWAEGRWSAGVTDRGGERDSGEAPRRDDDDKGAVGQPGAWQPSVATKLAAKLITTSDDPILAHTMNVRSIPGHRLLFDGDFRLVLVQFSTDVPSRLHQFGPIEAVVANLSVELGRVA